MAQETQKSSGSHVVTGRLSDQALTQLQRLTQLTNKTQSRLVGEAVEFYATVRLAGYLVDRDPAVEFTESPDFQQRMENAISKVMAKRS